MRGRFVFRLHPRREERITLQDIQDLLELLFGSFSEDLTAGQRITHFFTVIFGLAGGALCGVAIFKAAPTLLAWHYHGHDIATGIFLVPLNALWWFFRAVLLFGIPTWLVLKLLSDVPYSRWVAFPVIAFLTLVFLDQNFHFRDNHAASKAAAAAAVEAGKREFEYQQVLAAQEREHERLAQRRTELAARLDSQWRADVTTAGATGRPGVVPPMLKVTPMRQQVQVSNLTDQPLYLRLSRVSFGTDGRIERCEFDGGNGTSIGPHDSHRFQMFHTGNSPGCMNAPLEFRVGTASNPEPSWWSQSAFQDYVPGTPSLDSALEITSDSLQAEIADLERRLADHERVARWRASLAGAR